MTMFKNVDGEQVEMTAEEEAAITAEWAASAQEPAPVDARRQALAQAGFTDAQIAAILGA